MSETLLGIITVAVVVTSIYLIYLLVKLKSFVQEARDMLAATQKDLSSTLGGLQATLTELESTLRSTRHITDNVGVMTDRAVMLTESAKEVSDNVRKVSRFVGYLVSPPSFKASALRAGVQAGAGYVARHFLGRKA
jgi:uncharacterized protein YoxC